MSVIKPLYGSETVLTTTNLQSLGNSATAGWQSGAVDNSSALALGELIRVHIKLVAGSPGSDKSVYVYIYESEDGTNYDDNATGTEGTLTRRDPTNMKLLGTISTPDSGALTYKKTFRYEPPIMPLKWGIYINNFSGLALDSSGNVVAHTPVQGQVV